MRGSEPQQMALFSVVSLEARIPADRCERCAPWWIARWRRPRHRIPLVVLAPRAAALRNDRRRYYGAGAPPLAYRPCKT